jgi:DNA recombination-dependent growth factor C
MNNKLIKNILLVAITSFLFFCLIKIVGNMVLYNSMEINETERFFWSCARELQLPGEVIRFEEKKGIRFLNDKTIIKVKYKNDKKLKENEISDLFKKDGWKKENNRMIFSKKQSYVEVISTNEDYYEILYNHM